MKDYSAKENRQRFSQEEIQNISDLGGVLRAIRERLKADGISIDKEREKLLLKRSK